MHAGSMKWTLITLSLEPFQYRIYFYILLLIEPSVGMATLETNRAASYVRCSSLSCFQGHVSVRCLKVTYLCGCASRSHICVDVPQGDVCVWRCFKGSVKVGMVEPVFRGSREIGARFQYFGRLVKPVRAWRCLKVALL